MQKPPLPPPYLVALDLEAVWQKGTKNDDLRSGTYIVDLAVGDLSGSLLYSTLVQPTIPLDDEVEGWPNYRPGLRQQVGQSASFASVWPLVCLHPLRAFGLWYAT